jgi:hypothetical protein
MAQAKVRSVSLMNLHECFSRGIAYLPVKTAWRHRCVCRCIGRARRSCGVRAAIRAVYNSQVDCSLRTKQVPVWAKHFCSITRQRALGYSQTLQVCVLIARLMHSSVGFEDTATRFVLSIQHLPASLAASHATLPPNGRPERHLKTIAASR